MLWISQGLPNWQLACMLFVSGTGKGVVLGVLSPFQPTQSAQPTSPRWCGLRSGWSGMIPGSSPWLCRTLCSLPSDRAGMTACFVHWAEPHSCIWGDEVDCYCPVWRDCGQGQRIGFCSSSPLFLQSALTCCRLQAGSGQPSLDSCHPRKGPCKVYPRSLGCCRVNTLVYMAEL